MSRYSNEEAADSGRYRSTGNKGRRRRKKKKVNPVKRVFAVIGTTLLSLVLIMLITGSILAAALTVYVMKFVENTSVDINLEGLDESYSTFIYGYDDNGNAVEIEKLSRNADRIPIELDVVPQHVRDAFVYTEDARFYEHNGVDWKRTMGAFINEFLHMWRKQGGSTITQQLVKNITGTMLRTGTERCVRSSVRASSNATAQRMRYSKRISTILASAAIHTASKRHP